MGMKKLKPGRRVLGAVIAAVVSVQADARWGHASCAAPVDSHALEIVSVTIDGAAVPSVAPWQGYAVFVQSGYIDGSHV